jgi:hypothetical protein
MPSALLLGLRGILHDSHRLFFNRKVAPITILSDRDSLYIGGVKHRLSLGRRCHLLIFSVVVGESRGAGI